MNKPLFSLASQISLFGLMKGKTFSNLDFGGQKLENISFQNAAVKNADFSFCNLNNEVSFEYSTLSGSIFIGASFTNKTTFEKADVRHTLFLGATCNGIPITSTWLKQNGAINSQRAICTAEDLKNSLEKSTEQQIRNYLLKIDNCLKFADSNSDPLYTQKETKKLLQNCKNLLIKSLNPEEKPEPRTLLLQ